jgi:apolipoprotein N-acyltransferase
VPWDQLGYAQVDNFWLIQIAPYAGTYGIATVLMVGNALFAAALLTGREMLSRAEGSRNGSPAPQAAVPVTHSPSAYRRGKPGVVSPRLLAIGILFAGALQSGSWHPPAPQPTSATALLVQVNLGTANVPRTPGELWNDDMARFSAASRQDCWPFYPGVAGLVHREIHPDCSNPLWHPDLIAWPEAPSPFRDEDPQFRAAIGRLAASEHAAIITGDVANEYFLRDGRAAGAVYNSASFFGPDGQYLGRYDKIHLVPFGEYVPFERLFSWANALTQEIGTFTHGWRRVVFSAGGHTYGVFICYESVFSDEVRLFAKKGAQVFVNISDDGWYGDTSAPWQHLNMARMRAIENHRWLLLDTNDGLTSVIDPDGRVTQSIPRHIFGALSARYAFESRRTFYTVHGDIYAMICSGLSIAMLAFAAFRRRPL